jgi:CubicO group peptidase (beta-lactamase class C family)
MDKNMKAQYIKSKLIVFVAYRRKTCTTRRIIAPTVGAAMMHLAVVLLALMASGVGRAQAQTQLNTTNNVAACPQRKASVDAAFDAIAAKYSSNFVGMCVGAIGPAGVIAPNGEYAATKCYGETLTGSGIRPTNHTLFWIGSITKTMTATLLALRVNQGSVHLDDRVDAYLSSAYHIPKITLLHLADMESGLQRNMPNPYPVPSDETQLYTDLQACVGDSTCWKGINHYSYSNFGYGVLGNVLANHDGSLKWSLDNFYYVMAPLGMFDTKTVEDYNSVDFLLRRAYGHTSSSMGGWTPSRTTSQSFGGAPAGGLWSTPSDMLLWLGNAMGTFRGNRAVDAALAATMECRGPWGNTTCSSVQFCGSCTGLAWTEDIDQCTGGIRISKSGKVPGFNSWIGFDENTGRGVFVLLNSDAIKGTPVGEKLLDMIP